MQAICSNDAKIIIYDSKNRAGCRDAYSAFGRVWKPTLDWFHLSEPPGIDWDASWLLKTSLAIISNSNFLSLFSSFVLSMLAASNPYFRVPLLLMYDTIW